LSRIKVTHIVGSASATRQAREIPELRGAPVFSPYRRLPARRGGCEAALCLAAVCAASGVAPAAVLAKRRGRAPVARARQLALYLQHVAFGGSLSACGRALARERTSVRHACARIEDARDEPRFDRAVQCLEAALLAQREMLLAFSSAFATRPTGDDI
jgi:hypothetical protein